MDKKNDATFRLRHWVFGWSRWLEHSETLTAERAEFVVDGAALAFLRDSEKDIVALPVFKHKATVAVLAELAEHFIDIVVCHVSLNVVVSEELLCVSLGVGGFVFLALKAILFGAVVEIGFLLAHSIGFLFYCKGKKKIRIMQVFGQKYFQRK